LILTLFKTALTIDVPKQEWNDKKIRDKKITGPAIGVLSRLGDHVPDRYFPVHHILVSFPQRLKDFRRTRETLFPLRLGVIPFFRAWCREVGYGKNSRKDAKPQRTVHPEPPMEANGIHPQITQIYADYFELDAPNSNL
jgi:hypothetical protein